MITISTELKPCPFCGQKPMTNIYCSRYDSDGIMLKFQIKCNCGVNRGYSKIMRDDSTFSDYVEMMNATYKLWNERV